MRNPMSENTDTSASDSRSRASSYSVTMAGADPRVAVITVQVRYTTRSDSSTSPSMRPSCSFNTKIRNRTETPIMIGTSRRTMRCATNSAPPAAAAVPSTSRMLAMLEPTTFPTAIDPASGPPRSTSPTLTASSGALVPNATTVSPITTLDIPVRAARRAAPRTSASAPATNATSPAIRSAIVPMLIAAGGYERNLAIRSVRSSLWVADGGR